MVVALILSFTLVSWWYQTSFI